MVLLRIRCYSSSKFALVEVCWDYEEVCWSAKLCYFDKLGLSLKLDSFVARVIILTTDFAQHTLDQVLFCLSNGG